jgi:small subunit ribosomal protein S21
MRARSAPRRLSLARGNGLGLLERRRSEQVEKAGILTELRRREYFDKPSVRKKKKAAAAKKRALKRLKRMVP